MKRYEILEEYNYLFVQNGFEHLTEVEYNKLSKLDYTDTFTNYDVLIANYEAEYSITNPFSEEDIYRYKIYDTKNGKFIEFTDLELSSSQKLIYDLKNIQAQCKLLIKNIENSINE